ncbi:hypothetical protein RN001_004316 [Aquatica leii]|uniref:Aminopeptidase n=1 Tax=Aquatica leii TaxID=1421715 RepID=A0AAN7SHE9_9COLE|nr:hypothetical protein RN001_004316 [Aquatica leii]
MDAVTTFGKQNRLSISKNFALLLVILFIGCLVGTGVLVYHLSSCTTTTKSIIEKIEVCSKISENVSTTEIVDEKEITTTTAVAITEAAEKGATNKSIDVRLPQSVFPDFYDLKLIPFLQEGNFTFHGQVDIKINVTEKVNNITLHADELVINEASIILHDKENKTIPVLKVGNDSDRQFLVIYLTKELDPETQYNLHIEFTGILNDVMQGFYRSSYLVEQKVRWIAATQFQATDARKAFPCFDEPAMKAKFKLSLARPKNMSTISNMRIISSEAVKEVEDYEWDYYEESVPMSTYLVAFVVSDFVSLHNGNFSVWVRKDAQAQAKYSLDAGPKILKYFEDFFQIKFPLPKLDMIALPDFAAGAMENWGLVTYRETAMLYEEGVSSRSSLQRVTSVIAHELAHQWFGNLVTPKWWTDLWLNEGFASYMEYVGTNAVEPSWKVMDQFVVHELQNVLELDVLKSSHPVSIQVNNPVEINDIFDRISYAKGATIIRMMDYFLSTKIFKQGLTSYLNNRTYSSAEQDDLWAALTEEAHKHNVLNTNLTVKQIMDTWTLQTGFPLVTVTRSYNKNSVSFKQEKFTLQREEHNASQVLWWIPITYISSNNKHINSTWMSVDSNVQLHNITLSDADWLLVNVDQRGYYRVNYDPKNWQLLIKQLLNTNGYTTFSTTNRAQMIDDSLNLAAAGYLDYEIALNLTTYLVHEKDCIPWMSAFESLDYVQEMMVKSADFDKYKFYMTSLIKNIYAHVGFEDSPNNTQLTIYNRMEVLWRACYLGNIDCIKNAVAYFYNWKSAPNADTYNPISPNLKNIIYCVAIRAGGQEEWDFAWQRYLASNVGSEKDIIMSALGCSRETWILSRYLYWAVTDGSGIRKQDSPRVFSSVSSNIIGQDLVYRFFKNNWGLLKQHLGSSLMLLNAVVKTCISHINTEKDLQDFKIFLAAHSEELSVVSKTIEQSLEQIEANVRWMNNHYAKVVEWLKWYKKVHSKLTV